MVVVLLLLCNLLTDEIAAERSGRGWPISWESRLIGFHHDGGRSVVVTDIWSASRHTFPYVEGSRETGNIGQMLDS